MAQLLFVAGALGYLVSVFWLLTVARRSGFVWFVLCLFVSPLAVLFAASHWAEAKRPILAFVVSVVLMAVGVALNEDG